MSKRKRRKKGTIQISPGNCLSLSLVSAGKSSFAFPSLLLRPPPPPPPPSFLYPSLSVAAAAARRGRGQMTFNFFAREEGEEMGDRERENVGMDFLWPPWRTLHPPTSAPPSHPSNVSSLRPCAVTNTRTLHAYKRCCVCKRRTCHRVGKLLRTTSCKMSKCPFFSCLPNETGPNLALEPAHFLRLFLPLLSQFLMYGSLFVVLPFRDRSIRPLLLPLLFSPSPPPPPPGFFWQ